MNRAIRQFDLNAIFITGPGHGAPGIVANTYLEGPMTHDELRDMGQMMGHQKMAVESGYWPLYRYDPEREDRRPKKLMWSSDRAARAMVDAIAKRKREYTFTGHGKVGAFAGRHLPGLVHYGVTRNKS